MSSISCHVLDTARGRPAKGVSVSLAQLDTAGVWQPCESATTNADGRVARFGAEALTPGTYRVRFETGSYFSPDLAAFYPFVDVVFEMIAANEHYHIPLLISPYGYTTYRGS
ncbi:MAG TPA: hydroxyisourate hydrolase [Polyangiaceae bacterium]|nr:hydroxyisourate hydrolase [Polyangiaceae bacterium]